MAKTKLGKAKYGSNKRTYFKLKDGESVFRILPPLGELADDGKWSVFYNVHYGYKNAEGKNRPFQSPLVKNRKTKMVEVADAALERIDKLKSELEKAKLAKDKKTVDGLLKYVGGQKSQYNLDSNHYVNVLDLQGNIGVLKIRHRCKIALDATIKDLRDKGVDPLSVENGRYFVFRRTGTALDTSFQVTVYKEKITVAGVGEVERDVISTLSDELIDRLGSEAAELSKLFRCPSEEEVAQLVSESNLATGVSPNIDEILGFQTSGTTDATTDTNPVEEEYVDSEETETETTKVETKAETKTETKKADTTTKTTPKTTPQTTAERVADMSEDDFLESIGLK